jgi:hypothetical protein
MHARPGSRRRSRFAEFVGRSVHSRSPQRAHQDAVHLADNLIPRLVNGETPVSSSSERTIPPSSGKRLHDHRIATPYPASLSGYDTSSAIGDSRSGPCPGGRSWRSKRKRLGQSSPHCGSRGLRECMCAVRTISRSRSGVGSGFRRVEKEVDTACGPTHPTITIAQPRRPTLTLFEIGEGLVKPPDVRESAEGRATHRRSPRES